MGTSAGLWVAHPLFSASFQGREIGRFKKLQTADWRRYILGFSQWQHAGRWQFPLGFLEWGRAIETACFFTRVFCTEYFDLWTIYLHSGVDIIFFSQVYRAQSMYCGPVKVKQVPVLNLVSWTESLSCHPYSAYMGMDSGTARTDCNRPRVLRETGSFHVFQHTELYTYDWLEMSSKNEFAMNWGYWIASMLGCSSDVVQGQCSA